MATAPSSNAGELHDNFGFSSVDLTPRFGPGVMDLIESVWDGPEPMALPAVSVTKNSAPFQSELLVARHMGSISELGREDWNRLFGDVVEDWDYYTACEASNPEMFTLSGMAVFLGDELIGAVPMFRVNYRLDMSLPDALKGIGRVVDKIAPGMMSMPVLAFGSPMSEVCALGFAPALSLDERKEVLSVMVRGALDYAKAEGIKLTAFKDVADSDRVWADEVLSQFGFAKMGSLPIATLKVPFADRAEYLSGLSLNMRKSLKRKIKQSHDVSVEVLDNVEGALLDEIIGLYRETRANRSSSFEAFDEVPDAYFASVLDNLGERAKVMLFRVDGQLIGFNLFLEERDRVIGKFVGMHYKLSRKYNIYFLNWLEMVEYCIARGIGELHVGQTTYELKVKLGCELKRSWIFFRHDGRALGRIMRTLGAKFGLDRSDEGLRRLGDRAPYVEV